MERQHTSLVKFASLSGSLLRRPFPKGGSPAWSAEFPDPLREQRMPDEVLTLPTCRGVDRCVTLTPSHFVVPFDYRFSLSLVGPAPRLSLWQETKEIVYP